MNNIIHPLGHNNKRLHQQADEIAHRAMTRLYWSNVYLISTRAEVDNVGYLYRLANTLLCTCNRVIVLTLQSEFTHLIVAKSSNVSSLHANETLAPLIKDYGGESNGDESFAHATFYNQDMMPEIVDRAVESIIVRLPYV
jgi:alanyl-tRNA synthetase